MVAIVAPAESAVQLARYLTTHAGLSAAVYAAERRVREWNAVVPHTLQSGAAAMVVNMAGEHRDAIVETADGILPVAVIGSGLHGWGDVDPLTRVYKWDILASKLASWLHEAILLQRQRQET